MVCVWSDVNEVGIIFVLDEGLRYLFVWVVIIKFVEGLVEGWKGFLV